MGDVGKKENNTQPRLKRPPAKNNARRVCFSFAAYAKNVIDHLRRCQVPIARGLTDEEFDRIETTFSFTFPPDLRSILQEGLPVGVGFPNWRSGATQQLRMMMDLPMAGLSCEISKGRFWWRDWGSQPSNTEAALEIARNYFRQAPVLVPIYSHCYIPCSPNLAGNPIFFVYQKDIFYCGYDVADFFEREAFIPHNFKPPADQEFESDGGTSVRELIKEAEGDFERRFGNPETGMVKNWTEKNNSAVEPHEEKWEEFKRNPENWGKSSLPKISTRNKEIPGRKSVSGESSRSAIERPEPLVRSAVHGCQWYRSQKTSFLKHCTSLHSREGSNLKGSAFLHSEGFCEMLNERFRPILCASFEQQNIWRLSNVRQNAFQRTMTTANLVP